MAISSIRSTLLSGLTQGIIIRIDRRKCSFRRSVKEGIVTGIAVWLAFEAILSVSMMTLPQQEYKNPAQLSEYSVGVLNGIGYDWDVRY